MMRIFGYLVVSLIWLFTLPILAALVGVPVW